jgi:hypothetical protein
MARRLPLQVRRSHLRMAGVSVRGGIWLRPVALLPAPFNSLCYHGPVRPVVSHAPSRHAWKLLPLMAVALRVVVVHPSRLARPQLRWWLIHLLLRL